MGGGGETPGKVPVWRENHVEFTDGSLRGSCKEGKKQMTDRTEETVFKAFRDKSIFPPKKTTNTVKTSSDPVLLEAGRQRFC